MLKERGTKREWADRTTLDPDWIENHIDGYGLCPYCSQTAIG